MLVGWSDGGVCVLLVLLDNRAFASTIVLILFVACQRSGCTSIVVVVAVHDADWTDWTTGVSRRILRRAKVVVLLVRRIRRCGLVVGRRKGGLHRA